MALDYLAFERIANLIKGKIEEGRITKISQISLEEFLFIIRNENENLNLLVSTHPNMSYINLVSEKPESNRINTNLLMLLRKHLENGKIIACNQLNEDRVLCIDIVNRDDYFQNKTHKLYIELIGRASNLILTDETNVIIDSLKKIPLEYNNLRTIQPGIHYVTPDKPTNEVLPYDMVNELTYEHETIENIKEKIANSDTIYITKKDGKQDFHFIPFLYLEGDVTSYSWNVGLDEFYSGSLIKERHRQFTSELEKFAKNEIKKSEKKIKKLQEELNVSKEATIYKYYGDLLLTYMQGIKIKTDKVEVLDEETNNRVIIPYDLRYDLYKNANAYYKKYQKSKVALVKIQEQVDICKDNIEYFESIKYALEGADYLTSEEIKEELVAQGYFRKYQKPIKNNKNGKKKEKVYKPLSYRVNDITIYVGQNNLQNEYLTFKIANKTHLFLHVKDGPGAHVVVASDNVSNELLRLAANIAAFHSSYKMSSTVPVNYTLVKNIKKIPGGKPGKVIINNYKTIYVDPDESLFRKYAK